MWASMKFLWLFILDEVATDKHDFEVDIIVEQNTAENNRLVM